jgi:thiamine pyrophosphokinase
MDRTPDRPIPSTVLLLANGEAPSRALLRRLHRECGYLVAADGGANEALRCGLTPDVIIGDLDSLRAGTRRAFRTSRVIRVRRQDNTDLEKALDFVTARGARSVVIAGMTGRRIDFTLGSFSVLWKYANALDIRVVGDGWVALPAGRRRTLRAARGSTVSLIPFGPCGGITLRNLRYGLTNASMKVGEIGASNVVLRSPFTVEVRRGRMLIIILGRKRRAP